MNENMKQVLDRQLSSVEWTAEDARAVRLRMQEEEQPVKKKMSVSLVFALVLMLLTVTAVAAGTSNLLEWFNRYELTNDPQAVDYVQYAVASTEDDYAVYTVEEAAFDGTGAYLLVSAVPKDEHTLLMFEVNDPADPVYNHTFDPADLGKSQTISDFAAANGYTRTVCVDVWSDAISDGTISTSWSDGTLSFLLAFTPESDMQLLTLHCSAFPYASQEGYCNSYMTFEMNASAPTWEATYSQPQEYPALGIRVDRIHLRGSALSTYFTVEYSVTEPSNARPMYDLAFLTDLGSVYGDGFTSERCSDVGDGVRYLHTGSIEALDALPEALKLQVSDLHEPERIETHIFPKD